MRASATALVALVALVATAGCALTDGRGQCRDYRPLVACSTGTRYECVRTSDGCEQCSCVGSGRSDGRDPLPGEPTR